MNFSGIYENQRFYQKDNFNWIDCQNIQGTNGLLDNHSKQMIRRMISNIDVQGIHFIDNGNYHYISELWIEKIRHPFALVVFDHHSDMQKSLFDEMLGCGSWILKAIETQPYLQKVILIGMTASQKKKIEHLYKDKVIIFLEDDILKHRFASFPLDKIKDLPIYISIDKDILSKQVIETNWDQGQVNLLDLQSLLAILLTDCDVIGIDICGECMNRIEEMKNIKKDEVVNEKLIEFIHQSLHL